MRRTSAPMHGQMPDCLIARRALWLGRARQLVQRDHCRDCSDRLIPPPFSALFDRLIPLSLKLWRYTQEPHGSSTVSAESINPSLFK